jgi:hypothetical protein
VAFKFYTFSSWFSYNHHWVDVCYFIPLIHVLFINVGLGVAIKNMNFSFLRSVFHIVCWVSKAYQLKFASQPPHGVLCINTIKKIIGTQRCLSTSLA